MLAKLVPAETGECRFVAGAGGIDGVHPGGKLIAEEGSFAGFDGLTPYGEFNALFAKMQRTSK